MKQPDTAARGRALGALTLSLFLASCGGNAVKDGEPRGGSNNIPDLPGDAVPRPEPKSRYGNMAEYEVMGKTYRTLRTAVGYRERGVASWYGKKFHGRLTSSREPYDMYQMTAAHKSLPLPTYVRVRNLTNNREIVVRVNDRGPFVNNRIIDLSYAAALKLDMVTAGTALVEVEAITFETPRADAPRQTATPPPAEPQPAPAPARETTPKTHTVYAQVGAFGTRDNADRQLQALHAGGIGTGSVHEDRTGDRVLYLVRVGPIRNTDQYDLLVEELDRLGIQDSHLVTD
ncbi:MAG: septal ring lytic transglycosylase RlpA family protein [Pseudomonadota bacterium]